MTASIHGVAALLGRVALLAGLLVIVAGILGMHVMTASHSAHASHSVTHGTVVQDAAALHDHGSAPRHTAAHHSMAAHSAADRPGHATQPSLAPASCEGSCPGMQTSGTSCVPLAKAGSLAVAPPERSVAAAPVLAASIGLAPGYSYIADSPTPCELSISRT
jgi:hypothetical protein